MSTLSSATSAPLANDHRHATPGEPVTDSAIWRGTELDTHGWKFTAQDAETNHLVDLARRIAATLGDDPNRLLKMSQADFDLGPFAERLDAIMEVVRDGAGIALYRGLPMDDLSLLETAVIYWGMGLHLGTPMSNNPEGDMIGHVVDTGKDYNDPRHRGYQTNAKMDYHCDQTDMVALLCVQTAKSGGMSKIASSPAVHNELLRRRPDLVEVLTQPYCWTKHNEKNTGESNYYESPVFNFLDGVLCTSFGPKHMDKGHLLPEARDMTAAQREAIDVMEGVAEEFHAEMELLRGDIQFANNYTILHTRTEFEDWPEIERRRTLWRLWMSVPGFRPSTPYSEEWARGVNLNKTNERIALVYPG